mgnify:FL=1
MSTIDTELLSDKYRLALRYWEADISWLEFHGLSVYVVGPREWRHLTTGPLTAELDRAAEHHYPAHDMQAQALSTHLSRQGYTFKALTSRGHSQSDWLDCVAYLDHATTGVEEAERLGVLEDCLDTWEAWLWGDSYLLQVEQLVTYRAEGFPDLKEWLPVEGEDTVAGVVTRKRYAGLIELAEAYGLDLAPYREGMRV